jgi:peptide/nickel transport system permease protein
VRASLSNLRDQPRRRLGASYARFWQRFARQRLALGAAGALGMLALVAVLAPWLAPYDPYEQNLRAVLQAPGAEHWLGTDALGRDTLSRILYGARISLQAAALGVGIAALLGIPLGLIAGYYGGVLDHVSMRVVDMLFALPPLVLAFAILAIMGPGLLNVVLAVGIVMSTRYVRLTRSVVLAEREQLYVESARVGGLSTPTILIRHLLPNIVPPLIVQTAQLAAVVLLLEAALSFLGFGVAVGEPSWGRMLTEAQDNLSRQPFLVLPPGLALTLTVLALNLLGDGLRDAFERESTPSRAAAAPPAPTLPPHAEPAPAHISGNGATPPASGATPLLAVRHLEVRFPGAAGHELTILQDVSFDLAPGETLGIVGESGSGKSMTALALLGLIPPPGRISAGEIWLNGRNLATMTPAHLRRVRGSQIAMVFQEPMATLNPVLTIGQHLTEPLQMHHGLGSTQARARACELLDLVRVPNPAQRIDDYPHQLSGGMAQRVMIARALACNQRLLVCDEPTTALDVTVQGQILDLLADIQRQLGMAMIFITHDLAVVAEICDRVAVMYAGQVVERAPTAALFQAPRHPYTAALLSTLAQHDVPPARLPVLPGTVPHASNWPAGCRFHPRCAFAADVCTRGAPPLQQVADQQASRCVRLDEIEILVPR